MPAPAAAGWTPVQEDASAWKPVEEKPKPVSGFLDMVQRAGGRFAHNIGETVSGVASALTTNPATTFENMRQGTKGALDRMDKAEGLRKIAPALGAIPIIGPAAEQFAGDIQEQNYPEAFGDAASALTIAKAPKIVPPMVRGAINAGGNVLQMASKPAVLGTAGYVAGHALGKELGVPWYISGPAGAAGGRALGKYLSKPGEPLKPPMAVPIETPSYPPLEGVPYEKLPPNLQQVVRDSMGQTAETGSMPAPRRPVTPAQPYNPMPRAATPPVQEPIPMARQIEAPRSAFQMPPIEDASGVIKGWQPTVHEGPLRSTEPRLTPPQTATPRVTPEAPAPEPAVRPPAAYLNQETTGTQNSKLLGNRAAKADRFVKYLGGTQNLPRTESAWAKVATDMGENIPSKETRQAIMDGLNKLARAGKETPTKLQAEPISAAFSNESLPAANRLKALKIAQQLKQSMGGQ